MFVRPTPGFSYLLHRVECKKREREGSYRTLSDRCKRERTICPGPGDAGLGTRPGGACVRAKRARIPSLSFAEQNATHFARARRSSRRAGSPATRAANCSIHTGMAGDSWSRKHPHAPVARDQDRPLEVMRERVLERLVRSDGHGAVHEIFQHLDVCAAGVSRRAIAEQMSTESKHDVRGSVKDAMRRGASRTFPEAAVVAVCGQEVRAHAPRDRAVEVGPPLGNVFHRREQVQLRASMTREDGTLCHICRFGGTAAAVWLLWKLSASRSLA